MKIIKVILKSGKIFDLSDSDRIDFISRESITTSFKGVTVSGEVKWEPVLQKKINTYLRTSKNGLTTEIDESEIAVTQYIEKEEEHRI